MFLEIRGCGSFRSVKSLRNREGKNEKGWKDYLFRGLKIIIRKWLRDFRKFFDVDFIILERVFIF